jgi:CcmD family protein
MSGLDYLAAAYFAIWIAIFLYLLSIGRRAKRLEKELAELEHEDR